jgi:hypothetical protein
MKKIFLMMITLMSFNLMAAEMPISMKKSLIEDYVESKLNLEVTDVNLSSASGVVRLASLGSKLSHIGDGPKHSFTDADVSTSTGVKLKCSAMFIESTQQLAGLMNCKIYSEKMMGFSSL